MLIGPEDRVRLPDGVVVDGCALLDGVREEPIVLNGTGAMVAARADGRTVAEIASGVAAGTGAGRERALTDTIAFCVDLNRLLLLNVDRAPRRLAGAVLLLARGLRPAQPRRRGGLGSVAAPAAVAAALGAVAALPLAAAVGMPALAPVLGLSVAAGVVLHEAGHAALLRKVPWCVAVAGLHAQILHRPLPPGRRAAVAIAGPAAATLAGAVALAFAWALGAVLVALAAAPLVAQALGLTVLAGDGRTACGLS